MTLKGYCIEFLGWVCLRIHDIKYQESKKSFVLKMYFMKIFICLFFLTFMLINMTLAQQLAVKHSIQLDKTSTCYIEARKLDKIDNSWEITLSNFTNPNKTIKDTTFNHKFLEPDTILKIILNHSQHEAYYNLTSEEKGSFNRYNGFLNEIKGVIEKLQLSYSSDVMAGMLTLRKIVNAEQRLYRKQPNPNPISIEIQNVEIHLSDGYIDNISVIAKTNLGEADTTLQFKNYYPIGISSKKNLEELNKVYLFTNRKGNTYGLKMSNFFVYQFSVEKKQFDLSPLDTLIKVKFVDNDIVKIIALEKEHKNKIFEFNVFSDFIGLGEETPNGLVQIEAHRKIKLYTKYTCTRFPFGLFQYIEPSFRWNKIERSNAFLTPLINDGFFVDSTTQNGITSPNYNVVRNRSLSTLDLFLYQEMAVGFNLNLISGFNGNTKLKYSIDGIFNFGRTRVRDSVTIVDTSYFPYKAITSDQEPNEYRVNTIQWGFDFKMQFFPDARYGFTIGARYLNISLLSLDFAQYNLTYQNNNIKDSYLNQGILGASLQLHKNFDNDSKFYIRYVFNSQVNNYRNNFSQFQVGYNAYLKF